MNGIEILTYTVVTTALLWVLFSTSSLGRKYRHWQAEQDRKAVAREESRHANTRA